MPVVIGPRRASLVKQRADVQEDQLRSGMAPGAPGWGADPDDAVLFDGATGERLRVPAVPGDQRRYYAALREAMQERGPVPVTAANGAAVIALIEAALRSEAEGRRVAPG